MIHYFFIPSKTQVKNQNCNEWDFVTMFNSKLINEKNLCPHIIYTNDNKDLYDKVSGKWNEIQGLNNFKLTKIEIAKQDDSDNYFYELLDEIKCSVSKMKDKIVIAITGGAVFLFSWYMIAYRLKHEGYDVEILGINSKKSSNEQSVSFSWENEEYKNEENLDLVKESIQYSKFNIDSRLDLALESYNYSYALELIDSSNVKSKCVLKKLETLIELYANQSLDPIACFLKASKAKNLKNYKDAIVELDLAFKFILKNKKISDLRKDDINYIKKQLKKDSYKDIISINFENIESELNRISDIKIKKLSEYRNSIQHANIKNMEANKINYEKILEFLIDDSTLFNTKNISNNINDCILKDVRENNLYKNEENLGEEKIVVMSILGSNDPINNNGTTLPKMVINRLGKESKKIEKMIYIVTCNFKNYFKNHKNILERFKQKVENVFNDIKIEYLFIGDFNIYESLDSLVEAPYKEELDDNNDLINEFNYDEMLNRFKDYFNQYNEYNYYYCASSGLPMLRISIIMALSLDNKFRIFNIKEIKTDRKFTPKKDEIKYVPEVKNIKVLEKITVRPVAKEMINEKNYYSAPYIVLNYECEKELKNLVDLINGEYIEKFKPTEVELYNKLIFNEISLNYNGNNKEIKKAKKISAIYDFYPVFTQIIGNLYIEDIFECDYENNIDNYIKCREKYIDTKHIEECIDTPYKFKNDKGIQNMLKTIDQIKDKAFSNHNTELYSDLKKSKSKILSIVYTTEIGKLFLTEKLNVSEKEIDEEMNKIRELNKVRKDIFHHDDQKGKNINVDDIKLSTIRNVYSYMIKYLKSLGIGKNYEEYRKIVITAIDNLEKVYDKN